MARNRSSRNKINIPGKYILLALSVICVIMMVLSYATDLMSVAPQTVAGYTVIPFQKAISYAGNWLFNRSESLYFKRCGCKKEQLGVDLLNPSKAKHAKNIQAQNALKAAAQAAKTALADPTERASLEAGFAAQSKYTYLFAYTVAQKYVNPFE